MTFIHLKVHTSYSLLESTLPIAEIARLAEADLMPAIGITDTDNMFGALESSEKLAKAGIQPIIGTTLLVDFGDGLGRITLLAQDDAGYASLCKLSSEAHLRPASGKQPSVAMSLLANHSAGLLALSGGHGGALDSLIADGKIDAADTRFFWLLKCFGDRFYVEIQRHGQPDSQTIETELIQLAYRSRTPIVATHEVLFARPEDHDAHDALLAIGAGRRLSEDDRRRVSREHWFKPQADMQLLFADLPEAIENTVEIAKRCVARPVGRKPLLPHVADDEDDELLRQAQAGLAKRLEVAPLAPGFERDDYERRVAYECSVISQMKFPGYFLIVSDFIRWAKSQGIPVGPGRGSGAGSAVAWALEITDLDPLRFGLLFERFLNPERVSMPDFDVDFCQERREEVIHYVASKYGADRVAQIITHGTMQARAVVRDVGRVLSMPNGFLDKIAKLIPNNPARPMDLEEALATEPELADIRDRDETAGRMFDLALKLEGLTKHVSTHAAGVVIGDRPLDQLVPLYRDPKSDFPVTQFNWKTCEAAGLVKFDFLGLKTLTVIRVTRELIKAGRGIDVDLSAVPLDDAATFRLFANADTVGVFQLESAGMRQALKQLQPDRFEDIIAMVALYRPGPMDNIPTFVRRKHGRESPDYPHELIRPILEETYGVIVYQEQVIQIAQTLSGYTLGRADLLRRAMGKKDKGEMASQRARFVSGAVDSGLDPDHADEIFDLVDKFAGYGFNKSHAAAYALLSYHTAFLKANYREEFLAASMTLEMDDTDKLALFTGEAKKSGIRIAPPSINAGGIGFVADADGQVIRYALSGLKHVGQASAKSIIAERAKGPFVGLVDFARRIDPKLVTKRCIEMLASAGALDDVEINRAAIRDAAAEIVAFAKSEADDQKRGVLDLLGGADSHGARTIILPSSRPWSQIERCQAEYAAVGQFLSGHPLAAYDGQLATLGVVPRSGLVSMAAQRRVYGVLSAICLSVKKKTSRMGKPFAVMQLSDLEGQYEAAIFEDQLAMAGDTLAMGALLIMEMQVSVKDEVTQYSVRSVSTIEARLVAASRAAPRRGTTGARRWRA